MAEEGTNEILQEEKDVQEETTEAQIETPGNEEEIEAATGTEEVAETGTEEVAETGAEEIAVTEAEEIAVNGTEEVVTGTEETALNEAEETAEAKSDGNESEQIMDEEPAKVNEAGDLKNVETGVHDTEQPMENEYNRENKNGGDDDKEETPKQESIRGTREVTNDDDKISVPTTTPVVDNVGTVTEESTEKHEVDPHAPSPPPEVSMEATATVKFVLMPTGQVATMACMLGQTLKELKNHFATELKMPADLILLMFDGKNMTDTTTLAELGVGPNGTVQLEMQSADPINTPIKTFRPQVDYHMPDVITVRVQNDSGGFSDVVVEIERASRKKTYMGGYRHKQTGVEFHHASAQTVQKQRPVSAVEKFCRDTQTVQLRHQVQQTFNNMATQMTKVGVYVSNMEDKLVVPGHYTTAEEHHDYILKKIIILQKYYRRWLAKRSVQSLREDKERRIEFERQEEIRKKKEKENRIRKEFERRMNPKTKEDFDLLYHALEKWRKEELERINSELDGAERKAALYMLLEQESQLIAAIGRHKLEADGENKEKRVQGFLDKAAAPKRWKAYDGKYTEMDTPFTIRARELKDIYNSINMKYLTQDERLDVLLTLKHTVKEHDCKLTQEIIELIDREADLLMRGVRDSNLEGLRKRISTLFLQYIKTPTFNPEAASLLKVPQDPTTMRKNIYFCPSCNSYLPSTEFSLSSNSRNVGKCHRCVKIDNDGRTRQDYSHYRYLLKSLRRQEESHRDGSSIAFLLKENDLRYLVENIWSGQSSLSSWDDLYDLVLGRWDKHQEWSPWNCILLTKDEMAAHEKLESLEEGYGQVFMQKILQKHTLAKNYFSRLPGMVEHLRLKLNQKHQPRGPSVAGHGLPLSQTKA